MRATCDCERSPDQPVVTLLDSEQDEPLEVFGCPFKTVPPAELRAASFVARYVPYAKQGILPYEGGLEDQPAIFVDVLERFFYLEHKLTNPPKPKPPMRR